MGYSFPWESFRTLWTIHGMHFITNSPLSTNYTHEWIEVQTNIHTDRHSLHAMELTVQMTRSLAMTACVALVLVCQ